MATPLGALAGGGMGAALEGLHRYGQGGLEETRESLEDAEQLLERNKIFHARSRDYEVSLATGSESGGRDVVAELNPGYLSLRHMEEEGLAREEMEEMAAYIDSYLSEEEEQKASTYVMKVDADDGEAVSRVSPEHVDARLLYRDSEQPVVDYAITPEGEREIESSYRSDFTGLHLHTESLQFLL